MAVAYSFVSRWEVPVGPARCWAELERMLRPGAVSWWRAVSVDEAPAVVAEHSVLGLSVRSPLGYRLRIRLIVIEVVPGAAIAARSTGDLRGDGRLEIEASPGGSILTWRWQVATERAWMNATAPVLRRAFEAAHERVMRQGESGLRAAVARG